MLPGMSLIRRLILAFALMAGLSPAIAQVPAPVPALPDTERRTTYAVPGTTCACSVGFALFGDGVDFQNWVEVWLNGAQVQYNDASFGWTITTPSGSLGSLARPITNAVLTFNSAQTGTVQIVGARRPRRTSQFTTQPAARDFNQVLTDIIAQNREIWDKTNDITGRGLFGVPGETVKQLPPKAARAGSTFTWDSNGDPSFSTSGGGGGGGGNVVGQAPTVVGHAAVFNNTTGTGINDGGGPPATYTGTPATGHIAVFGSPTGTIVDGGALSTTSPTVCNLKNQMDAHYGAGGWTYRVGVGTGTDIGPAITDCKASFVAGGSGGRGVIYVPATGWFALKTSSINSSGITYAGDGSQASKIFYQLPNGNAFFWSGASGFSGGGMQDINIVVEDAQGATTATAILWQGSTTDQPGAMVLRSVYVNSGGTSTWGQCLTVDGSLKTTGAQGIRGAVIKDVQLFLCNNIGAQFNNAVQFTVENLGVYSSTGAGQDIFVAGGGVTGSSNSTQMTFSNVISRNLNITNADRIVVHGWGTQVQVAATLTHSFIWFAGTQSGACGANCTVSLF